MIDFEKLEEAVTYGFSSYRNIFLTATISFLTYLAVVWASNPTLASRTLASGLHLADELFFILSAGSMEITGILGFGLILIYSALSGIAVTNFVGQIKLRGFRSMLKIGGIAPGIVASGCAGCGVGLAALIGVSGALASLPFNGNLIRLGGIGLLAFFLVSSGDPRKCELNVE